MSAEGQGKGSIRRRVLASVGALVVLSLTASAATLYRITEVNRSLDAINRVTVPLSRKLVRLRSDAEILQREMERGLGYSHWKDPHWRPRPIPQWIVDIVERETDQLRGLVAEESGWATPEQRRDWRGWVADVRDGLTGLRVAAAALHGALARKDSAAASEIYPRWVTSHRDWLARLEWGGAQSESGVRAAFRDAEERVSDLRTGLQVVLAAIVILSLIILWVGERALRPLEQLTGMAREITRRGLRREDKALVPLAPLSRNDEVSALSREFHHMATALLEREKTVEVQKSRLQEQNRLLQEAGALNESILVSIRAVLIVADPEGVITQGNPEASRWLGIDPALLIGTRLAAHRRVVALLEARPEAREYLDRLQGLAEGGPAPTETLRVEPCELEGRVYGAVLMPLRGTRLGPDGSVAGVVLSIDDMTDRVELERRLRLAENLATVGRMSAQVAHEVRNPLHSIGLEAEVALELAARDGSVAVRQSVQAILESVDRLEKITENYLRLSRPASLERRRVDLGSVLESVLATYAQACQRLGISVDWEREPGADLSVLADVGQLEQALGNLLRNAIQSLEGSGTERPAIRWRMGRLESGRVWISIEDNGPGVAPAVREKIFTPFVTTKAQGTGLGLPFVKKVIEDHGGDVACEDPGQGARFAMRLPAAEPGRAAHAARPEEMHP